MALLFNTRFFKLVAEAMMGNTSDNRNYQRIAKAITYIRENFKQQPSLDQIASFVGLSSFHLQKLFTEWAGVSPKKFIQYLTVEHAKKLLTEDHQNLMTTAFDSGLSGTSRLHDLFVKIEGMTPGEYKNGGENLKINYCFAESVFGNIIVASTAKGICHLSFEQNEVVGIEQLKRQFPNAHFSALVDQFQQQALAIFQRDWSEIKSIKLHLAGTAFQLKVWQNLLKIPAGQLTSYANIAQQIDNPKASRAVGSAIGNNPIGYIIPCHRVIQTSGKLGGYRWGMDRKSAIIGWESAARST